MTDISKETSFKQEPNIKKLGDDALRRLLADSLSGNSTPSDIYDIHQPGPSGENDYGLPSTKKFEDKERLLVGVAFLTESDIHDASQYDRPSSRQMFLSQKFPTMDHVLRLRLSRQGVLEDLQRMLRYYGSSAVKQQVREANGHTQEEVEERLREKGLITKKRTEIVPGESAQNGSLDKRPRVKYYVNGPDKDRDPAQWDKFAAFKQSGKEAPAVPNSPQFTQNYTIEGLVIGLYAPLLSVGIEMVK